MPTKEETQQALASYSQFIKSIDVEGNMIVVRPIGYIKDKGVWKGITDIVASLGGQYKPERNNNTWQLPIDFIQSHNQSSTFTPSDPLAVTKHIDDIIISLEALKKEIESILRR